MTAFGVTNASADPTATARASAFGVELSLLGEELVEATPEVSSEFPPGSSEEEDILTVDAEDLLLEGVTLQQAETSGETDIEPSLVSDGEDGGGSGVLQTQQLGGGGDDEGGLIGGIGLEELIDDLTGGGGGGGDDEGDGSAGGIGGPDDDDIDIPLVNARGFSSISLTGVAIDEGDGTGGGGGSIFDDILNLDDLPVGSNSAGEAGTVEIQQTDPLDSILGEGVTGDELQEIIFDALLRLGVVESEAVATCTAGQVRVDVASRLVDDQGSDIEIGEVLDDVISSVLEVTDELAPDLIRTIEGEVVAVPGGVGINALHIIVGEGLGGDILGDVQAQQVPEVTIPEVPDTTIPGDGGDGEDGEDEPLLDIVLAHSEVSGNVCAQQAAPPAPPLPPAGDDRRSLPVTGGGLGVLPAVLGLGLAGGAVAAGRVALRSRREHTL